MIHAALHGQYHRGQINQLLRADGQEPAVVDFMVESLGTASRFPLLDELEAAVAEVFG